MEAELLTVTHTAEALDVWANTVRAWADQYYLLGERTFRGERVFRRDMVTGLAEACSRLSVRSKEGAA